MSSLACSHYGKHVATPSRQLTGLTALRPHAQCFPRWPDAPCSATHCVCSSGTCHSAHQHDTLSKWNTMHRHTCYVRCRPSPQRRAHSCRWHCASNARAARAQGCHRLAPRPRSFTRPLRPSPSAHALPMQRLRRQFLPQCPCQGPTRFRAPRTIVWEALLHRHACWVLRAGFKLAR